MKDQRWKGDYENVHQEFRAARSEEMAGMHDANASHGNDFLTMGVARRMDDYEVMELEPSWSMQLDTNGMQPHAREYLERESTGQYSARAFMTVDGQSIDYCPGIHFDGRP